MSLSILLLILLSITLKTDLCEERAGVVSVTQTIQVSAEMSWKKKKIKTTKVSPAILGEGTQTNMKMNKVQGCGDQPHLEGKDRKAETTSKFLIWANLSTQVCLKT